MEYFRNIIVVLIVLVAIGNISTAKRSKKGKCKKAVCNDVPTAQDGIFELVTGNGKFGSVAIFKCLDGTSLPCDDTIAVCGAKGECKVTGTATCPTTLIRPTNDINAFGTIDSGSLGDVIDTDVNSCLDVSILPPSTSVNVVLNLPTSADITNVIIRTENTAISAVTDFNSCSIQMVENGQVTLDCLGATSSSLSIGTSDNSLQLCDVQIFISQECASK